MYTDVPQKYHLLYGLDAFSISYCSNHLNKQIKFIHSWRDAFVSIKEILTFLDNCLFFHSVFFLPYSLFTFTNKACHHDQCSTLKNERQTKENHYCAYLYCKFWQYDSKCWHFSKSCMNNQQTIFSSFFSCWTI